MKKILILLLLFAVSSASAQTDTTEVQTDSVTVRTITLPDSTAIGAPDGKSVSKEIGSAGGKIVSDDGRVELIFPADALTANTTISIQPTTNLAPNGVGKSYWFEPSGIQFKKPVQIIFRYTDEEAEICPQDWMSLGIQSKNGKWSFVDYESFDSVSKTLKGYIHHFSGVSNINDVQLTVYRKRLPAGRATYIDVSDISTFHRYMEDAPGPASLPRSNVILWYANGILDGNEYTGKIRNAASYVWEYTAPQVYPKKNPVKISAEIYRSKKRKVLRKKLNAYILVYVQYKVTVGHDINLDDDVRMSDSSFFNLEIDHKASISYIQNQLARLHIRQSSCRAIYVNATSCAGMINVTGINESIVRPGVDDDSVWVDILFQPAPLVFPIINFPPCGSNRASPTTMLAFSPYAFPMRLSFQLKNEKQYISLSEGVVVMRPDPEDFTATIEPIRE